MNTSIMTDAKATEVKTTSDDLIVFLADGREIKVPLVWFPKLSRATVKQRNKYRLIGNGVGIHWLELDEDLSVAGFLSSR